MALAKDNFKAIRMPYECYYNTFTEKYHVVRYGDRPYCHLLGRYDSEGEALGVMHYAYIEEQKYK